jgi:hypothetical protein
MYSIWFDGVASLPFDAMPHSYVAFTQLLPALPLGNAKGPHIESGKNLDARRML